MASRPPPISPRGELDAAARQATAATAGLGAFLRRELLTLARDKDACGPEIYARASRYFLGAAVDLTEAYAWSWEEITRLRAEQAQISNLIRPGATRPEVVAVLEQDPARRIQRRENFRAWMQELAEGAIAELHGAYFDRSSIPGLSAWAAWAWTRCARPWPGSSARSPLGEGVAEPAKFFAGDLF